MCYYECRKRDPSQKPQCCRHQKADTWKGDPKWYSDAQQSFLLCRLRPSLCSWERLIVVAESSWQAISSISISSRNIIGKPYEKKSRTGQVIGGGKTRTALLERRTDPRRFASSEKFKKMTELGRSGREKYLALGQDALHGPRCAWSIHPDPVPNIISSGPPTELIRTYSFPSLN